MGVAIDIAEAGDRRADAYAIPVTQPPESGDTRLAAVAEGDRVAGGTVLVELEE